MIADFESEMRSTGDLAGVYEFDGKVSCFYLYAPSAPEEERMLGAIPMLSGTSDQPSVDELLIRWDSREEYVGLFVRGELRAVFDASARTGYADGKATPIASKIPPTIKERFTPD